MMGRMIFDLDLADQWNPELKTANMGERDHHSFFLKHS